MKHLDLFSGIGGFAYAIDQVWDGVEHTFCDNDPFCRAVVKKHWPESDIYDDIRSITTDTDGKGLQRKDTSRSARLTWAGEQVDILTGGFPCQPFSEAGFRRGTADDRYLWPEMLRVIRLTQPTWVIAENVRGIFTWNDGMVFEQVCLDLEAAGYEVQTFIIPAVAVNAPHRRDRVWFVAKNAHGQRSGGGVMIIPRNYTGKFKMRDQIGTATGMKLQPNFVAWMMGYPPGWADLNSPKRSTGTHKSKPTGTPSSPK